MLAVLRSPLLGVHRQLRSLKREGWAVGWSRDTDIVEYLLGTVTGVTAVRLSLEQGYDDWGQMELRM